MMMVFMVFVMAIRAARMLMRFRLPGQEMRVDLQFFVQVELTHVQHLFEGDPPEVDVGSARARIDPFESGLKRGQFFLARQVGLGEQYSVGESDLPLGRFMLVQLLHGMLGAHDSNDGIQQVIRCHGVVHEEGLRHRARIGNSRRFDNDAFEVQLARFALLRQGRKRGNQVSPDGAANAARCPCSDRDRKCACSACTGNARGYGGGFRDAGKNDGRRRPCPALTLLRSAICGRLPQSCAPALRPSGWQAPCTESHGPGRQRLGYPDARAHGVPKGARQGLSLWRRSFSDRLHANLFWQVFVLQE